MFLLLIDYSIMENDILHDWSIVDFDNSLFDGDESGRITFFIVSNKDSILKIDWVICRRVLADKLSSIEHLEIDLERICW